MSEWSQRLTVPAAAHRKTRSDTFGLMAMGALNSWQEMPGLHTDAAPTSSPSGGEQGPDSSSMDTEMAFVAVEADDAEMAGATRERRKVSRRTGRAAGASSAAAGRQGSGATATAAISAGLVAPGLSQGPEVGRAASSASLGSAGAWPVPHGPAPAGLQHPACHTRSQSESFSDKLGGLAGLQVGSFSSARDAPAGVAAGAAALRAGSASGMRQHVGAGGALLPLPPKAAASAQARATSSGGASGSGGSLYNEAGVGRSGMDEELQDVEEEQELEDEDEELQDAAEEGGRRRGVKGGRSRSRGARASGGGDDSKGGDKRGGGNNGRTQRELMLLDPKRVRRIIANRMSAAKSKERKQQYTEQLSQMLDDTERERAGLQQQMDRYKVDNTRLEGYVEGVRREASSLTATLASLRQQGDELLRQLHAARMAAAGGQSPQAAGSAPGSEAPVPVPPEVDAAMKAAAAGAAAAAPPAANFAELLSEGLTPEDLAAVERGTLAVKAEPMASQHQQAPARVPSATGMLVPRSVSTTGVTQPPQLVRPQHMAPGAAAPPQQAALSTQQQPMPTQATNSTSAAPPAAATSSGSAGGAPLHSMAPGVAPPGGFSHRPTQSADAAAFMSFLPHLGSLGPGNGAAVPGSSTLLPPGVGRGAFYAAAAAAPPGAGPGSSGSSMLGLGLGVGAGGLGPAAVAAMTSGPGSNSLSLPEPLDMTRARAAAEALAAAEAHGAAGGALGGLSVMAPGVAPGAAPDMHTAAAMGMGLGMGMHGLGGAGTGMDAAVMSLSRLSAPMPGAQALPVQLAGGAMQMPMGLVGSNSFGAGGGVGVGVPGALYAPGSAMAAAGVTVSAAAAAAVQQQALALQQQQLQLHQQQLHLQQQQQMLALAAAGHLSAQQQQQQQMDTTESFTIGRQVTTSLRPCVTTDPWRGPA